MILAKIQYSIFLNAVPWKYSTYGTWLIAIHSFLGLTGAPLLLFIYAAAGGSSDVYFLFSFGFSGTLLGLINVIGIITIIKIYKTIGYMLLLIVYSIGSLISTLVMVSAIRSANFNILGFLSPIGLVFLFFFFSGWFTLSLLGITVYKIRTKKHGTICYSCSRTYKVSDQYCEDCGRKLVTGLVDTGKIKRKQGNQTI